MWAPALPGTDLPNKVEANLGSQPVPYLPGLPTAGARYLEVSWYAMSEIDKVRYYADLERFAS